MTLTLRPIAAVAVAVAATVLAACSAPPEPRVATAAPVPASGSPSVSSATAPPSKAAPETDYDKALRYTRCMTTHGARTADPVAGEALVTVNIIHVGDSEATIRARRDAFAACRRFLPATWPLKEDLTEAAAQRPFRDCMRGQGVAWPEPDANGVAAWPTDPLAMTTPAYNAALRVCRHLLDDPANNLLGNQ